MITRDHDPPPSSYLHTPSPESSPSVSILDSDCDADDEAGMEPMDITIDDIPEFTGLAPPLGGPLSLSQTSLQPTGPYCPRIPTLQEILTNRAPPPWTLAAFTAHLSQNHCLENLQFITAAERYRTNYTAAMDEHSAHPQVSQSDTFRALRAQWVQLLDAFIRPNAAREVNLAGDVRDALVALPNGTLPPPPSALDSAIQRIMDLMNDSILLNFINESTPARPQSTGLEAPEDSDDRYTRRSGESGRLRSQSQRKHSPVGDLLSRAAYHHHTSRSMHTSHGQPHRPTLPLSTVSVASGETDETASSSSPTNSPMTPPTTPPSSDLGGGSPKARTAGWRHLFKQGKGR